jgi:hypothetical protein
MSMNLEMAFDRVGAQLAKVQDAVSALQVTVAEDKPRRGEVALVDRLENVVMELLGALEGARTYVAQAGKSCGRSGSPEETRLALRNAHQLVNAFIETFATELATHDSVAALLQMGRERGREWADWAAVVKTAIEQCAIQIGAMQAGILDCWSELGERLARQSVSVQSTNIGQQITLREDQLELAGKAT